MIGKLKGFLDSCADDYCIIDVNGVGYCVYMSAHTRDAMPEIGEAVSVHIETIVREDMIRLYGFAREEERGWYRLLTTVQGVGAKVALSILSTLAPDDLSVAIGSQNKGAISKANGVGAKMAERICLELKNKVPQLSGDSFVVTGAININARASIVPSAFQDAISALVNLGYTPVDAQSCVVQAAESAGQGADTQTLIRLALKGMAR